MGICFVGKKRKFSEFLEQYVIPKPGDIKTLDGIIIGKYKMIKFRSSPLFLILLRLF